MAARLPDECQGVFKQWYVWKRGAAFALPSGWRECSGVIQALKYVARDFRSFKNYRTRILFFCDKFCLSPRLPCH